MLRARRAAQYIARVQTRSLAVPAFRPLVLLACAALALPRLGRAQGTAREGAKAPRGPLVAHADIVIEAGPPFPPPPKFTNWGSM
jgi:hypothetical protein